MALAGFYTLNECGDYAPVESDEDCTTLETSPASCNRSSCDCVYLPFHKVLKHVGEIQSWCATRNKGGQVEAIVREKIRHLSRLFDAVTNVENGYYSAAHLAITDKTIIADGTQFLDIGVAIPETIELCRNGKIVPPQNYVYQSGSLVLAACSAHTDCLCPTGCFAERRQNTRGWGKGCYYVKARFGSRCADELVEAAIMAQMLNDFRIADPKEAIKNQLYPQRPAWTIEWKAAKSAKLAEQPTSFC